MEELELVRKALIHRYCSHSRDIEAFYKEIDRTGGWPLGFGYVSFYHALEDEGRICKFTNQELRTGWWTTVCTSDDYYYWKLSDKKKKDIAEKIKKSFVQDIGWLLRK